MESHLYAEQFVNELRARFDSPEFTHRTGLARLRDRVMRRKQRKDGGRLDRPRSTPWPALPF